MALNFYDAYMSNLAKSPKEKYLSDLDATINRQFQNSSSWATIEEETGIGTNEFNEIIVRLNKIIDPKTGTKLGDEYRKIIFKERVSDKLGLYYKYNEKTWISSNPDLLNLPTSSTVLLKCNDYLRWYDENGAYKEVAIFLDSTDSGMGLDEDKYMILTDGKLRGLVQFNNDTAKLLEGTEFLFGREEKRAKYRISFEDDFETNEVLRLKFDRYQVNTSTDNLALGIANYTTRPQFTIAITPTVLQFSVGNVIQLEYSLLDNDGQSSDKEVVWSSSDDNIIDVDSNGVITAISNGSATIYATMTGNSLVSDSIALEVTATPIDNFELSVNNNDTSIIRTSTETFNWELLNNGVIQPSNFTFSIDASSTASPDEYVFTVTGVDTYTIKCLEEGNNLVINILEDGGLSTQVTYNLIGYW